MSAIAQCHRSAVKTRPSTPRALPEPTQKSLTFAPHFRRPDCAKPSLAGEGGVGVYPRALAPVEAFPHPPRSDERGDLPRKRER